MAHPDKILAPARGPSLRVASASARPQPSHKRFGLVFEEHVPEVTALPGWPVEAGEKVQRRGDLRGGDVYRVTAIDAHGGATLSTLAGDAAGTARVEDLTVVKSYGEPVYPCLRPLGAVQRGSSDRPHHAVINGENLRALELLTHLYARQVDCIYIDPPYNTGAKDWKYNNRFVDAADEWSHSKWLSFMEKRLRLAARLLREDGVLIVTIDEHEVHHLGVLLEQVFPSHLRYTVTVVNNPKGTFKANFGRVDEQVFFVVPNLGRDIIVPMPAQEVVEEDPADRLLRKLCERLGGDVETLGLDPEEAARLADALEADTGDDGPDGEDGPQDTPPEYEDWFLRRRGAESSYRHQRPNQFYAVLVNEATKRVVGVGPALAAEDTWEVSRDGDVVTVFPVDKEGNARVWRYRRETMLRYIEAGEIVVGRPTADQPAARWSLNHRKLKKDVRRHKTVWWDKRHDAGVHGTAVINQLLGQRGLFPFPKSVYAVRDCLAAVTRNRPNALIVDFFAGSGTTFHATCLLNAEDGGARRCVLVTNNEVDEATAKQLHAAKHYRGDPAFEAAGIFERVTRPRCTAVVTGRRPDGSAIPGKHVGGRPFALGFNENVEFFRLDYLRRDDVDFGEEATIF